MIKDFCTEVAGKHIIFRETWELEVFDENIYNLTNDDDECLFSMRDEIEDSNVPLVLTFGIGDYTKEFMTADEVAKLNKDNEMTASDFYHQFEDYYEKNK